jgi:hypothetical protein
MRPLPFGCKCKLSDQARLSDSAFAVHEHERPRPTRRTLPNPLQAREFRIASDERQRCETLSRRIRPQRFARDAGQRLVADDNVAQRRCFRHDVDAHLGA